MSDFDRQNTWLSLQPVTGVKFDDGTTQTSADVEGTVVKSTGEGGGTKFLREDGDGTCSWQDGVSEGTDVKSTGESAGTKFLREDGDGSCSWQAAGSATEYGEMNFLETEIDIPTQSSISDRTALTSGDWHDLAASSTWEGAHALICRITMGWGSTPFTHSIHFRTNASGNDIEVAKGATARWGGHTGIVIVPVHTDGSAQWKWEGSGTWGSNQSYFDLAVIGHMDGNLGSSPEGTAVKSTTNSNETSGKVLTADGDGTSSWQEASATGAMWSSGWVNEDSEGETIAAGTAFKFTHNLSTTDVTVTVYAADDSSGTYATKVDFNYDSINTTRGAIVFDVSTNSVMIRTMVSYQAYPGEDSGSTDSGTFRSWASKYIKVIVQAGGVGANQGAVWSSGWVDEDDSAVAVDDGATLTFAHNLGTTDVSAFLIIATDSDGSGSYSPDVLNYGHKDQSYGFHDFTTSAVTVQLGAYRSTRLNTSGAGAEPGSWSGYYIKIVIMSASGGGKVLQIVQSKQGTEDITVDADGTFAESQYEIAITPSSTSSKVLVTFTGQALGVSTCQFCWAIYADDSKILDCGWSDHSTYGNNANLACQFLHSPATSIEVSYKLYFASDNGGTVRCAYGNFGDVPAQYIMGMAKEIAE